MNKIKNIEFLYECRYRNDGTPQYLRNAAKHNMGLLGLTKADHHIPIGDLRKWGKYDLHIWVDFGDDCFPISYVKCPKPNAYWVSDAHLGFDYRVNKAKEFDLVFLAQKDFLPKFRDKGIKNVYWLPHAVEPLVYNKLHKQLRFIQQHPENKKPVEVAKRYDVCFIGYIPCQERAEHLDVLFRKFPNFKYASNLFFEDCSYAYLESKIVFNYSVKNDINMRVFEVSATGSLLLTNYFDNGFEDLGFIDGKNIVFYRNKKEMIEKAEYYLAHDKEREQIGNSARELVLNEHTYLHRIKGILSVAEDYYRGGNNGGKRKVNKRVDSHRSCVN